LETFITFTPGKSDVFAQHARVMRGFGKACVAWGSGGEITPSLSANRKVFSVEAPIGIMQVIPTNFLGLKLASQSAGLAGKTGQETAGNRRRNASGKNDCSSSVCETQLIFEKEKRLQ